jgi:3-phenylpropionate/trans-cinnamate dioxygenase ferredoxin reductase component
MNLQADVLVVGAGQAGAQLALSLRQGGLTASVMLVGAEPDLPYERPPLSKDYLLGARSAPSLALRAASFWAQRDVRLHLGEPVTAIDAAAHTATLASGTCIRYGHLVWAAGGRARRLALPGADLPGIHVIRSRADVDRLRASLPGLTHVGIVGAGYLGLELATALRTLGKRVTVLEAQPRVLPRVACPQLADFYEREHRAQGVAVRTAVRLAAIRAEAGRVAGVEFAQDAPPLSCDALIAAIGIEPETQVLQRAGARCSDGVEVDSFCHTSLPDVFAIGDCANHANRYAGNARVRLESVANAVEQARTVASVLLGQGKPYSAVPWFWSNQYDLRLQTVGLNLGYEEVLLRGAPATRSFSAVSLREGRVIAIDCANAPRDFVQGKALVEPGSAPPRELLADANVPLKTLADAAD